MKELGIKIHKKQDSEVKIKKNKVSIGQQCSILDQE